MCTIPFSQNPTSEAVALYKCEVARLEDEIKKLKKQLVKAQQGINESSTETVVSSEEDIQKIQGWYTFITLLISHAFNWRSIFYGTIS